MQMRDQLNVFRSVIFLSAFLLFSIQPMIAKILLPWFGGSSSVWTVALVFFTTMLLLGYVYGHVLGKLRSRVQVIVHSLFVVGTMCVLILLWVKWGSPFVPDVALKPDAAAPIRSLLVLLGLTIGVPYVLLASTTPVVQSWFHATFIGAPYKLYSLSNRGSIGALLLYPIGIEPFLDVATQGKIWAGMFGVLAVLLIVAGWIRINAEGRGESCPSTVALGHRRAITLWRRSEKKDVRPLTTPTPRRDALLWIVLAAVPSLFLILVTNALTQGVASAPFLWVVPLAIYLFSFVLVFADFEMPWPLLGGLMLATAFLSVVMLNNVFAATIVMLAGVLVPMFFVVCIYFHQWLYERRPEPSKLTTYYVYLSVGGALGTTVGSVLLPILFVRRVELYISLLALILFCLARLLPTLPPYDRRPTLRRGLIALTVIAMLVSTGKQFVVSQNVIAQSRNFYGTLSVVEEQSDGELARKLLNGRILHGLQFQRDEIASTPTTYYVKGSGVGQEILFLQSRNESHAFGFVGLGTGALAAYCRPTDEYRFFEIDPDVIELAQTQFSFLAYCTKGDIVLGDARLSLEQEQNRYDLLVIDAFTDDSIPVHLLTREAFKLYADRLNVGGVLAVHISNRYLKLAPVVKGSAKSIGFDGFVVSDITKQNTHFEGSMWVLLSGDPSSFPVFTGDVLPLREVPEMVTWTDAFSNLLSVVRY